MKALVALAFAAASVVTGCGESRESIDPAPSPEPGGFHTWNRQLRDDDHRTLILRGANLAGSHKYAPYFGFHGPDDYARLSRDWGMNAIRFLMVWAAIEPEEGKIDDHYLDEVAKRMDWAADAGLLVVLDMHQDVYGEGFLGGDGAPKWTCDAAEYAGFKPASSWYLNYLDPHVIHCFDHFWHDPGIRHHYIDAWRAVAARLKDKPAVVGFDIINEPYWGSKPYGAFEEEVLGPFYEDVVPAVREVAPGWVAFVEPSSSRNLGIGTQLAPPTFASAVYAPHSYDTTAERGMGFPDADRAYVLTNAKTLASEATGLGAALWIGEYGGDASKPGIGAYMDAECDAAASVAAGATYWAYDADEAYGLVHTDKTEKTELLDVVVRPVPQRVAGDVVDFAFDTTSRVFTMHVRPDASVRAPTEIAAPARVYPKGVTVDCGGCTVATAPGLVRLTDLPAGDPLAVVLSPKP